MHRFFKSVALFALLAFAFLGPSGCLGCSAAEPSNAADLRRMFPEQAARVLDRGAPLRPTPAGFTLDEEGGELGGSDRGRPMRATFPRGGGDSIHFELADGFSVQVSAPELMGEGALEAGAVVYSRPGGASFWTATEAGFEEWLLLEEGLANAGQVVASWEVSGAALREEGEAIFLVDERGSARIRVTAPEAFAAGGREVEAKLSVDGARIELRVDAGGDAVLVDPEWTPTGPQAATHLWHAAARLPSGEVLVTGSYAFQVVPFFAAYGTKDVEVYSPVTNQWSVRAPMIAGRFGHTATLLPNGKVLVAGGFENSPTSSAELYDPATNLWAPVQPMASPRQDHTETLLDNGKALLTGGGNATAEMFDPGSSTWTVVPNMSSPRQDHTATKLNDGKVLVAGGSVGGIFFASAELFDPATNTWISLQPMSTPRRNHVAAKLDNGKVLVAGGDNGAGELASAELFDPINNTWTPVPNMGITRRDAAITKLLNGKALVTGGISGGNPQASAELFDPAVNAWAALPAMNGARYLHTSTLLLSGKVLVVGYAPGAEVFAVGVPGDPCSTDADCPGAFCADGVCCNTICAGPCSACSVAAGAAQSGTCSLITGVACDDGNACTPVSTCNNGVCEGSGGVACQASDQCHAAGVCDPMTGVCSNPAKMDGSACSDGNPCTTGDACQAGACLSGAAKACPAIDQCHLPGSCDTMTGLCSEVVKANGTACDDGNLCTVGETCFGGVCLGGSQASCAAIDQCHDVGVCNPATGACTTPIKANGTACNDNNQCTQADTCQGGVCTAGSQVLCQAMDQCHTAGVCNPQTGVCSNPLQQNGVPCNDLNACTPVDTCQGGVCSGVPKTCAAVDQCHDAGICDPQTGTCSSPAKPNGSPCSDGTLCTQNDACQGGACLPGAAVACSKLDGCHEVGVCDASTGICSNPPSKDGAPCDDGSACTQKDFCQAGTCTGANPVVCQAPGQCQAAGVCDPISGNCLFAPKADGAACDDGNACTQVDSCQAGLCQGSNSVMCAAQDQCHEAGACDPATGQCSNPEKQNDTPCDDNNKCTLNDTCQLGQCTGSEMACPAADACHIDGICNPLTGECSNALPDGAPCDDGDKCTSSDTCKSGVCGGESAVTCPAQDQCHTAGICDPTTGACSNPPIQNGTLCDDGDLCTAFDTCQEGVCSGAVPVVCDPPDACHKDGVCNPATGICDYASNGEPCLGDNPIESSGGGCACRTAPASSDRAGMAWLLALFTAGLARRGVRRGSGRRAA